MKCAHCDAYEFARVGDEFRDRCSLTQAIINQYEIWHPEEERSIIPTWCPKPQQFHIVDKCINCRDFCDVAQHCKTLRLTVESHSIHPECPLEDAI
jgi:hypothetical protein